MQLNLRSQQVLACRTVRVTILFQLFALEAEWPELEMPSWDLRVTLKAE